MALTEKLTAIAESLRQALSVTDKFSLAQMPEKISQLLDAGKQAQRKAFWETVPEQMRPRQFAGPGWNSRNFYPNRGQVFRCDYAGGYVTLLFRIHNDGGTPYDLAQRLQDCGARLDCSQATTASEMFRQANVTRLPELDFSKVRDLNYVFANCEQLHTLDKLIVSETAVFQNAFTGCVKLANLQMGGTIGQNGLNVAECPLTRESLLSILNALKDGVSGKTVTLGANNLNKLTAEEKAIATNKGWVLQ